MRYTYPSHAGINLPGPVFQVASILLMAFQSFVAPILLGLESFGEQILFLSSVLLSQAIFEPIAQFICNKSALNPDKTLNASDILLGLFISISACVVAIFIAGIDISSVPSLALLLLLYMLNTFLAAFSFSEKAIGIVATSSSALFLGYLGGFFISHKLFPGSELTIGLISGMSVSVFFFARYWIQNGVERVLRLAEPNFGEVLAGFTFRLPTVVLTTVNILLLSWLAFPATVIGQYKIFVSAIMAGRYFNLVPLPQVQVYLQTVLTNGHSGETRNAFLKYIVSFAIFGLLASLVFPILFDIAFEDRQFSRLALALSVGAILLQPSAYAVLASRGKNKRAIATISIAACALFGSTFALATEIMHDPFIATGPSVLITLCFYWVNLRNVKET